MAKLPVTDSRQVQRRAGFDALFFHLSRQYGGEPRRVRRSMARDLSHKQWKEKEQT
jgi:hypothetical protein